MYTVSIIIRQQPKLTSYLKEEAGRFIESLVTLYGDMEFLFSEKGEFEKYLLFAIDKVRKGNLFSGRKVVVTWVSNESLAEFCLGDFFFDRGVCIDGENESDPFLPIYCYMINRSDFLLYYAGIHNRQSEDLVRYAKYCDCLSLNLADLDDRSCIIHKES